MYLRFVLFSVLIIIANRNVRKRFGTEYIFSRLSSVSFFKLLKGKLFPVLN
jgi:hypothetical protein